MPVKKQETVDSWGEQSDVHFFKSK